jgi:hypothetical protein
MIINGMLNDGRLQSPIVADYKTNKRALAPACAVQQTMRPPRKTAATRQLIY